MYSGGLGIAPAVAAALIQLAVPLLGSLFGPSESDVLYDAARTGNVVAWWRLKALAARFDLASYGVAPLTASEAALLVTVMGPGSDQPEEGEWSTYGSGLARWQRANAARARLVDLETTMGPALAAAAAAVLRDAGLPVPGDSGGALLAGMDSTTMLVLGGGLLVALLVKGKPRVS